MSYGMHFHPLNHVQDILLKELASVIFSMTFSYFKNSKSHIMAELFKKFYIHETDIKQGFLFLVCQSELHKLEGTSY